eukprot:5915976-Amphidinium_carterae.1
MFAAAECKADREIVLAAVRESGCALEYAAEECKAERGIVLAALQQDPDSFYLVADELLLDSTFAPEVKQNWYI